MKIGAGRHACICARLCRAQRLAYALTQVRLPANPKTRMVSMPFMAIRVPFKMRRVGLGCACMQDHTHYNTRIPCHAFIGQITEMNEPLSP